MTKSLLGKVKAYEDALTPSGHTKAVHSHEYFVDYEYTYENEDGEEETDWREIPVPWTVIKEIMQGIKRDAESS